MATCHASEILLCLALILCTGSPANAASVGGTPAAGTISQSLPSRELLAASPESGLVKITATLRPPDLFNPWKNQRDVIKMEGVGTIITGKRILTNAHLLRYATRIWVQPMGSDQQLEARMLHVAPAIDLAVLTIDSEQFFIDHAAIPLATEMAKPGDQGVLYTFAEEGATVQAIAAPVVNIKFEGISHLAFWLRYELNAAIVPGNSGAPLLLNGKMLGIVRSRVPPTTAFAIANKEIELFLADIEDGQYDGKSATYDESFSLGKTPAARAHLGLNDSIHGVVISNVLTNAADYPLQQWDVITKVGQVALDDNGYGITPDGTRLWMGYFSQTYARDGKIPYTIVRDGKSMVVEVTAHTSRPKVIPFLYHNRPSYFIFGPIAFSQATEDFLEILESGDSIVSRGALSRHSDPLTTRREDLPAFSGEQIVIVPCGLFPHPLAEGINNPQARVVHKINGTPVKNLGHLVKLLRDCAEKFVVIEFAGRYARPIIFPREECAKATIEVLKSNRIVNQGSPDLLALWNQR
jgi:S1-C subfamily serine protease